MDGTNIISWNGVTVDSWGMLLVANQVSIDAHLASKFQFSMHIVTLSLFQVKVSKYFPMRLVSEMLTIFHEPMKDITIDA